MEIISQTTAHAQLHKRISEEAVKQILDKYVAKEFKAKQARVLLGLSKSAFFVLAAKYKKNGNVGYVRKSSHRIAQKTRENVLKELAIEKEKIIDNPQVPVNRYNYSFIQRLLPKEERISVPSIIKIAREAGYTNKGLPKKIHDRIVQTSFVGELLQHDSPHHLFAPDAGVKWKLITTLDDYSRKLLFADLFVHETSWSHIQAVESVALEYGFAHSYYVDNHGIFRYVHERDSFSRHYVYEKFTDDVDPQFKIVLKECGIGLIYALSPQAKGKVERNYRYLQDELVRRCVRAGVTTIEEAREVLYQLVYEYNQRVHSTTGEIPNLRFNQAIKEGKTLFTPFKQPVPLTTSDLFSLKMDRRVDNYRYISIDGTKLKTTGIDPLTSVTLRLRPHENTIKVRIWDQEQFNQEIFVPKNVFKKLLF